jgi:hypothetical protein
MVSLTRGAAVSTIAPPLASTANPKTARKKGAFASQLGVRRRLVGWSPQATLDF